MSSRGAVDLDDRAERVREELEAVLHREQRYRARLVGAIARALHAQGATKTVSLSRDEVIEIQTTVDLFIEEISRRQSQGQGMTTPAVQQEPQLVVSRN